MSRRAAALNRTRCGAYGSSLPARSRALPQTPPARAWQRPRPRASPQAPCPAPSCRVSGARLAEPSAGAPPLGASPRLQRAPVRVVGGPSGFSRSFALPAPFSLRCRLSFSHRELVFRRPAWRHSRSSLRVRCCPVRVSWQSQMPTPRERLSPVRGQLGSEVQGGGFLSAGPTQGQCWRSTRRSPVSGCDAFPRRGGGQFQRRPKGQRLPRLTAAAWTRLDEQEERRSGRWCGSARGPGGRAWQGGAATLTRSCTAFRRGLSS